MVTPPSQKCRPIFFYLSGGAGPPELVPLTLRPQDMTRHEPSRLTVQQTIGGAWADAYGPGISTITLNGHTGWHGTSELSGEEAFLLLRDTVFVAWHERRAAAAAKGMNPETIQLIYVDSLDSITALVAPKSFQLQRKKDAPLLYQYNIQLAVLADRLPVPKISDPIVTALASATRWIGAADNILAVIGLIEADADSVASTVSQNSALGLGSGALPGFIRLGVRLLAAVAASARDGRGVFGAETLPLLQVGLALCGAGRSAFAVLAMADGLSAPDKGAIMAMASRFGEGVCLLSTGFNAGLRYPDYSQLFGASNCSSTAGGRPWSPFATSRTSPFAELFPAISPPVLVSGNAQAALDLLRRDPLVLAEQPALVVEALGIIVDGVALP